MSPEAERYAQVARLFDEVMRLPHRERHAFLATACADDPDLRREVEQLLAADALDGAPETLIADDALASLQRYAHAGSAEPSAVTLADLAPPERIGRYRIVRQIGVGGMGIVYEAEQENPRRRVALKVVQPGMASPERLRRLRHEATVLGRLQHPAIAQVYEAGSFDLGRGPQPFFAMEFVEGMDLLFHAERQRLDLGARMRLLATVCDGVQHAHDAGVIHRDLKPENILVDASGRPRILDFGIARASDTAAVPSSVLTQEGQILGTLTYMAPEQFSGHHAAVSPRSDVYSLGVIAFELACGKRPHDVAGLPISASIRVLAESVPARLGTIDGTLRGDVETIVGKALAKDPLRRYESAAALAADLRRWLDHLPIAAMPPSRLYLARKFAQRHRGLVFGAVSTTVTLVVGLIATTLFALDASEQRHLAELRERQALQSEMRMVGAQLTSATLALRDGKPWRAADLLHVVPERVRGWEWHVTAGAAPRCLQGRQPRGGWSSIGAFVQAGAEQRIVDVVDGRLQLWDLRGEPLPDPAPDLAVATFGCAPETPRIVVGTTRGEVLELDLSTGQRRTVQSAGAAIASHAALASRGRAVAWVDDMALHVRSDERLWTQTHDADLQLPAEAKAAHLFFDANGDTLVYVVNVRRQGTLWRLLAMSFDIATSTELARRQVDAGVVHAGADPVTAAILLPGADGFTRYDGRSLEPLRSLRGPAGVVSSIAFSADGTRLALSSMSDGIHLYDTANDQEVLRLDHGMRPTVEDGGDVRVSPDGKLLLVTGPLRREMRLVDISRSPAGPLRELRGHSAWIYQVAISHDGSVLASSAPTEPCIRLWNLHTGSELARLVRGLGDQNYAGCLAFSDDDRRLLATSHAVASGAMAMHSWDLDTGACEVGAARIDISKRADLERFLDCLGGTVARSLNSRIQVLSGGRVVAKCDATGADLGELHFVALYEDASPRPSLADRTCVAADAAGRWLACGRGTGLDIYDAGTGALLSDVPGVQALAQGLAFSPDGTRLAVGCNDGRVILLETRSFEVVLSLDVGDRSRDAGLAYINALAWTPDGTGLVTASGDGVLRLWSSEDRLLAERRVQTITARLTARAAAIAQWGSATLREPR